MIEWTGIHRSPRPLNPSIESDSAVHDKAMIAMGGGKGKFGKGRQLIRARNPGEARNAMRPTLNFTEARIHQEHTTKVGMRHNSTVIIISC